MNPTSNTYDELMMSYLEGQCREEEAHALLSWIAESEKHQKQFESFKSVWELTSFPMPEIESIDIESALSAVNEKIDVQENHETITVQMPWLRRNLKYVSSAAAAVIIALFLGFLVVKPNPTVTLASADWNTEEPYILPDETSVTFVDASKITYPKRFGNDGRAVEFDGTARFDVAKDETRPFVIHCDGMDLEVLGTSFLLNADKASGRFVVDLYSGKVRMTALDKKGREISSIEIEPTQRGILDEDGLTVMSYPEVKSEELAKDHVLDFNDVPLSVIVETIQYVFGVEISLPAEYAEGRLTARFTDEDSVSDVVETIATVFDLKVSKKDDSHYSLR